MNNNQPTISNRLYKLKFYFDNLERNQINELATFEVKSDDEACRVLAKFVLEGAKIRAAFLVPNEKKLSKTAGFRFYFENQPTYKHFIGSD